MGMLVPGLAYAQISGTVFHDRNGNGIADRGEPTLSGVSVTDGKNVVKTDNKGRFRLPENPAARFITVTTPTGFQPMENHYIPVDPQRKSYDFGLKESSHSGEFQFIQITDTEAHNYKSWIDQIKQYVSTNPTAFIMHTGDICYKPGLEFHAKDVRTKQMGVPMYYIIGNHDLVAGDYGEQFYESLFGPVWYSFDVGNVHFLALPMLYGDHAPSYKREDVLEWMKNDLAMADPSKKVIMFNHDLWFTGEDLIFRSKEDSIDMSQHRLEAFIYGHWHNHYRNDVVGVKTFCASTPDKGGIDHSPSCFRVFHIDADGTVSDKTHTRYTQLAGISTITYPAQDDTVASVNGMISLSVNAYRTASPTTSVKITHTASGAASELSPVTDWAWEGAIALNAGPQAIEAQTTFADGTVLRETRRFVVRDNTIELDLLGNWENLGGNAQHTGVYPVSGDMSLFTTPQVAWVRNTGGNICFSSPVIGEGRVFVGTLDDDNLKRCGIHAYDAKTGEALWSFKTENSVKNSIVYQNGIVLACDAAMNLYGLEAATGNLLWSRKLQQGISSENVHGLAVENGIIYAGQGGGFSAVRISDGQILWTNKAWRGGEGTTSTTTIGGDVVLVSAHWNGLFAHDKNTGELLWKIQDQHIRFRDGSATYSDGKFYLGSRTGVFVIDAVTGEIEQSVHLADITFEAAGAPVVTADRIYLATANKGVVCVDRKELKLLWNYRISPALFYTSPYSQDYEMTVETSPVLIGEVLVFGASDGYLYGVNAQTGRFAWKRNMGAPVFSSPAVSGDALIVSDFSGNVYGLKMN